MMERMREWIYGLLGGGEVIAPDAAAVVLNTDGRVDLLLPEPKDEHTLLHPAHLTAIGLFLWLREHDTPEEIAELHKLASEKMDTLQAESDEGDEE